MCRRPEPDAATGAGLAVALALAVAAAATVGLGLALEGRARADEPQPALPTSAAGPEISYSSVVRAVRSSPQPIAAAVDTDEARSVPGAAGDPTVAAQNLPGVARPAPGATGLVLWGATPAETRVSFDGVELPALYHFGGFRSTVGTELVGRVEVVPGAYGADYGRALGGLTRIDARALAPAAGAEDAASSTHLALDANLLDATAALRHAAPSGIRVAAAARASLLDETYGRYAPARATALFPIPHYADAQAQAELDVGSVGQLRALVLLSRDRVARDIGDGAPGLPDRTENQRRDFWRAALTYEERGSEEGLAATLWIGADATSLDQHFGATLAESSATESVAASQVGLRARYRARLTEDLRVRLGVDGLLTRAQLRRTGSLTVPAREGDITVFGQAPGDQVGSDTWSAAVGDLAPYLIATFARGPLVLVPGLRAAAFAVDGSRALPPVGATPAIGYAHLTWALEPRLAVTVEATPMLSLTAAGGLYHQPVDPADLSAVFGSPSLAPSRAWHATAGGRLRLGEASTVEVTSFYRHLDGLAVRSPLPQPLLGAALLGDGHGRTVGAEIAARHALARGTFGWASYAISRSERWTDGGSTRLMDFDQTHVATAVLGHRYGAFGFGARARYATGMPRTPVVGAVADLRDGTTQPIFGAQNTVRLPAFFQVDARVDRTFTAGPATVTLYLDVENLTARRNAEERVYARDFTASGVLTGPPLLLLVGVRVES